MAIEIIDLPIKVVIFKSYFSLPEGKTMGKTRMMVLLQEFTRKARDFTWQKNRSESIFGDTYFAQVGNSNNQGFWGYIKLVSGHYKTPLKTEMGVPPCTVEGNAPSMGCMFWPRYATTEKKTSVCE